MSGQAVPASAAHAAAAPDETQFRALAETAPDAIVIGDASGRIRYVNAAAERLFGHPAAELAGQSITVLMPPEFRGAHTGGFERFIATGRGRIVGTSVEVEAQTVDGRRVPIELSLGTTGTGASRTLTAVIRDLTARRRRERHLDAQLAVTRVLAEPRPAEEAAPRIVEALTRALGWDAGLLWLIGDDGTLRAAHTWQADPDRTAPFVAASQALRLDRGDGLPGEALTRGEPVWFDDLGHNDGFLRREEATASGLRAAICLPLATDGEALGVIELYTREPLPVDDLLRDLLRTVASQVGEHLQRRVAQERLAAELARSNVELEQLAHTAAHDLRAPLQTAGGFAELIDRRHGATLPDDAREALALIIDSVRGGAVLLDNLLAFARAGGARLDLRPVALGEVLDGVLIALRGQIEARDAAIHVADDLPAVTADPVQLGQVLQNLVANAIAFTPAGAAPVVEISAGASGPDHVRVSVRDHGIGVDAAEAARLFERFARGTRGAPRPGTGIGLAVCARIVTRHGGRIWADPAPGGGSTFSFTVRR